MESLPLVIPAPTYPKRRQQLVATAIFGGAVAVVLVALVSRYLETRAGIIAGGGWKLYIPLTQPNVMMGTLVLTSIAAQWGTYAIARNYRLHSYWALGIVVLLGLAFLNQSWFMLTQVPLENGVDPIASSFYAVVGTQMLMIGAAIIYSLLMGLRTLAGSYNPRYPEGVASAALFWHISTGVYALVWYAVYITK